MHEVEPMPAPALSVMRRLEEAVDESFPSAFRFVGKKRLHLVRCGGEAGDVQIHALNQRAPVSRTIPR